jgi:hypothetical protein
MNKKPILLSEQEVMASHSLENKAPYPCECTDQQILRGLRNSNPASSYRDGWNDYRKLLVESMKEQPHD